MQAIPVKSISGDPLGACKPPRARKLVQLGKATLRRDNAGALFLQLRRPVTHSRKPTFNESSK